MTANPPIWAIGDLQGCCTSLDMLLAQPAIASDLNARFWFAGDLINRGPDSLGALRRVIGMGERAVTVLGNHDLHLLAVAAGIRPYSKSDTFADILAAPDADQLIDWVRHRPMAHYEEGYLLVHAGVLPAWDLQTTLALAEEVQTALRAPDWAQRLKKMYGNKPVAWRTDLGPRKRLRLIINALTRMRLCNAEGHMDFDHKNLPADRSDIMPWFDVAERAIRHEATIIFGHWSVLGLLIRPDVICLDTGCVWGRQLSALRLHDHQLVQIACRQHRTPRSD